MSAPSARPAPDAAPPRFELVAPVDGEARLALRGSWSLSHALPSSARLIDALAGVGDVRRLDFDSRELTAWDSGLASVLVTFIDHCEASRIEVDRDGLPEGLHGLLRLARAVPEREGARRSERPETFLERLGNDALGLARSTGEIIAFVGASALALGRLARGDARFRRSDLWLVMQESGADALPIVSLVTFLVGVVLAYIGSAQLAQFGARIFVADLVGLAMVIQMGALITAIVLAGRTGAAFAAQLGTMQANEEIDALRTLGIAPMEFLVLPRMLALVLMTPLLAVYANLMGILGGAFVVCAIEGATLVEYFVQTRNAIGLNHAVQGVINATVYGAIVAISGCMRGMQCGRSASAVGDATTSAVVTSIVFIAIAATIMTIIFDALGL